MRYIALRLAQATSALTCLHASAVRDFFYNSAEL